jgi:predicted nucleic acid-binding protein
MEKPGMKAEVFLDTAYAIALSSPTDLFHARAVQLADEVKATGVRLVTTRAVTLEIANALSKQRYREAAARLLDALEADGTVEIVPLSEPLYQRAWRLFRERPDKDWGLTDCVSFVVMKERGITDALTPDVHFQQANFQALMR